MLKTLLFWSIPLSIVWLIWRRYRRIRAAASKAASAQSPDDFHRLTREAMVYANWPQVTVMHHVAYWPEDPVLVRTTADPYGKRVYVETHRLIAGKVIHVACKHLDGAEVPVEVGTIDFPAEQTCVYVLKTRIEDIVREGVFLSLRDHAGRVRETRLPKESKHHA